MHAQKNIKILYLLFSGHETFRTWLPKIYLGRKIIGTSGKGLSPVIVTDDWTAGGGKKEGRKPSISNSVMCICSLNLRFVVLIVNK